MSNLKKINMGFNYKIAEEIISIFNSDDKEELLDSLVFLEDMNGDDLFRKLLLEYEECIIKPKKDSILHYFILKYINYYFSHQRYWILEGLCNDRDFELAYEDILTTIEVLKEYDIDAFGYLKKIDDYEKIYIESDYMLYKEYKKVFQETYDEILKEFNSIKNNVAQAVFYLLYSNKEFLYKFNDYLSNYISPEYISKEYFDSNKHLIRCDYLPKWLERAVFYRDNGRCQNCGKDLSGYISIIENKEIQYDHIIPLEANGTNDSTNFQLLCKDCNLKKGGKAKEIKYFYQMYW